MQTIQLKTSMYFLTTLVLASSAVAQNPVWPIQGPRDLLHGYQQGLAIPITNCGFTNGGYFHEGVDILGTDLNEPINGIYCMRAGDVVYDEPTVSGGTVIVEVSIAGGGTEWDSYLHIAATVDVGDSLVEGDVIGRMRSDHFNPQFDDHLHINRFSSWTGGDGYSDCNRQYFINPLSLFTTVAEADPQQLPPTVEDGNGDNIDFQIFDSATSQSTNPDIYDFAWGGVDLLVDAGDDQSVTKPFNQSPSSIGYWVDGSRASGSDVAGPLSPYLLTAFNDAWRPSGVGMMLGSDYKLPSVYNHFELLAGGSAINTFSALGIFRLTNAAAMDGLATNVDDAQFWNTDVRTLGSQANGSNGVGTAIEIQEAVFSDGPYDVHVLLGDQTQRTDTIREVQVDNFRPYLSGIAIRSSVTPGLYRAAWLWNAGSGQLELNPATPSSPTFSPTGNVLMTIVFSEPVSTPTITAITPSIGFVPTLTAVAGSNGKVWTGTIPEAEIADDGSENGTHTISVRAEDLNGSPIWQFSSTSPVTAPFNKRMNSNVISDPSAVDNLHFFTIG